MGTLCCNMLRDMPYASLRSACDLAFWVHVYHCTRLHGFCHHSDEEISRFTLMSRSKVQDVRTHLAAVEAVVLIPYQRGRGRPVLGIKVPEVVR
jgi:hypothetical protein